MAATLKILGAMALGAALRSSAHAQGPVTEESQQTPKDERAA